MERHRLNHFLRVVFHLLAALHFIGSCYYDWHYTQIPERIHRMGKSFGKTNKLKYLTFWDALLQAIFFSVALLNDLFGTNEYFPEKPVLIRKIKDTIFASLAFPLASFVGITFWSLYFVDRELVLPKALDPYFPFWLNHCMHTNIMLFIGLELLTTFRRYPKRSRNISILSVLMLSYLVWIHVIHAYTNVWVYPVLDVLSLPMRLVFFFGLLAGALMLYFVGEWANTWCWRHVAPAHMKSALAQKGSKTNLKKKKRRKSKVMFDVDSVENDRREDVASGSGVKLD